jgi:hypothetical protein
MINTIPPIAFTVTVEKLTEVLTVEQLAEQWVQKPSPETGSPFRSLPSTHSPTTFVGVQGTMWSKENPGVERLYVAVRDGRAYYAWFFFIGDAADLATLEYVVSSVTPLQ